MEIAKIIYLIGLTKDVDFPYDNISNSILDSYFENSKHIFVIRNSNREYIEYTVQVFDKLVKISKKKDDFSISYELKFNKILNRYFADLYVESNRSMVYEFNDDILNKDNVLDWKIVREFDVFEYKNKKR